MTNRDIPLVVDVLPRMGNGVAIVALAIAVMDDFHAATDDITAHDGVAPDLNPHDGQVGRVDGHCRVLRREIHGSLHAERVAEHQ